MEAPPGFLIGAEFMQEIHLWDETALDNSDRIHIADFHRAMPPAPELRIGTARKNF